MKILILGGGGLGTVLGAHLAQAGAEVTLFVKPTQMAVYDDACEGLVRLHISGLSMMTAAVRIACDPAVLNHFDYLLVCVKGRDTESAIAPLAGVDVPTVLSLQNGVRKDEVLARYFGRKRVLGALTGVGGTLQRPGYAVHTLSGTTVVGELDGGASERGERLAAVFRRAGLPAVCVPDILTREWHKLATFLPGALLCSITRLDVGRAMLDPDLARLRARLCHEIARIARAEGHAIEGLPVWISATATRPADAPPAATLGDDEERMVAEFALQGAALRARGVPLYPSMTTDILTGRPTELEDTAGDALARAARHSIPTPVMEVCYRLLKGIERSQLHRGGGEGVEEPQP